MMSEGEVRQLLATLKGDAKREKNPMRLMAFSGGVSALEMVLGEGE